MAKYKDIIEETLAKNVEDAGGHFGYHTYGESYGESVTSLTIYNKDDKKVISVTKPRDTEFTLEQWKALRTFVHYSPLITFK